MLSRLKLHAELKQLMLVIMKYTQIKKASQTGQNNL